MEFNMEFKNKDVMDDLLSNYYGVMFMDYEGRYILYVNQYLVENNKEYYNVFAEVDQIPVLGFEEINIEIKELCEEAEYHVVETYKTEDDLINKIKFSITRK